jgi:hypothetical protein
MLIWNSSGARILEKCTFGDISRSVAQNAVRRQFACDEWKMLEPTGENGFLLCC